MGISKAKIEGIRYELLSEIKERLILIGEEQYGEVDLGNLTEVQAGFIRIFFNSVENPITIGTEIDSIKICIIDRIDVPSSDSKLSELKANAKKYDWNNNTVEEEVLLEDLSLDALAYVADMVRHIRYKS